MRKYILKEGNVAVTAEQLTAGNVSELANETQSQIVEEKDAITGEAQEALNVKTPDGTVRVNLGMYIVKALGNFYVFPASKFEDTYRLLDVETVKSNSPYDNPFANLRRFENGENDGA